LSIERRRLFDRNNLAFHLKLEALGVMHHSSYEETLRQLLTLGPQFTTYVATFIIPGGFSFLDHLTLRFIRHANSAVVWLNLFFLMFVALLPFSAGLWATCCPSGIAVVLLLQRARD
jgi:uncharacterized membrane protein